MKRYLLISIVLIFLLSLSVVIADETMPSNVSTGECPAYPIPDCKDGFVLKTKTDENGCAYYSCECPTPVEPQCS